MDLKIVSTAACALALVLASGCSNLPGNKGTQGAVIGGVTGAAVGAAVGGERNRVLGAVLGGAAGAAGGYVIGANSDKILGKDKDSADEAVAEAKTNPATPEEALKATNADINSDGFVTLDEVVAMKNAGFSDEEMLKRLRTTDQVFELTDQHRTYLRDQGVSQYVIDQLDTLNQEKKDEILTHTETGTTSTNNVGREVIGRDRSGTATVK